MEFGSQPTKPTASVSHVSDSYRPRSMAASGACSEAVAPALIRSDSDAISPVMSEEQVRMRCVGRAHGPAYA